MSQDSKVFDESLPKIVLELLSSKNKTLATAESCTGGLLGKRLTDYPGASQVYQGGVVTYSNQAKEIVGVRPATLKKYGAVSKEVAEEMARGVCEKLHADYGIGITGISGPGGGSAEKPVGTTFVVIFGNQCRIFKHASTKKSHGSRAQNRDYASNLALDMIRLELK